MKRFMEDTGVVPDTGWGLGRSSCKPTSKSWLRAAIELSSLKSMSDVAKVRKNVPSIKQTELAAFSGTGRTLVSGSSGEWVTFDGTLEQLGEDAIGCQLMEDTAKELLGHTCCIAGNHHAAFKHRRETQAMGQRACVCHDLEFRLWTPWFYVISCHFPQWDEIIHSQT